MQLRLSSSTTSSPKPRLATPGHSYSKGRPKLLSVVAENRRRKREKRILSCRRCTAGVARLFRRVTINAETCRLAFRVAVDRKWAGPLNEVMYEHPPPGALLLRGQALRD